MTMIGMEMIFQTDLAAAGLNMKYVVRNVDVTALSSLELETKVYTPIALTFKTLLQSPKHRQSRHAQ